MTYTLPPDLLVTKVGKFLSNRFKRDNEDMSEKVNTCALQTRTEWYRRVNRSSWKAEGHKCKNCG